MKMIVSHQPGVISVRIDGLQFGLSTTFNESERESACRDIVANGENLPVVVANYIASQLSASDSTEKTSKKTRKR